PASRRAERCLRSVPHAPPRGSSFQSAPRPEAPPAPSARDDHQTATCSDCVIVQQSIMARVNVLIAAVLFGTTGTAQALGPTGLSPLTVGAARVVVGGGVLGALALALPRTAARMSPLPVLAAG